MIFLDLRLRGEGERAGIALAGSPLQVAAAAARDPALRAVAVVAALALGGLLLRGHRARGALEEVRAERAWVEAEAAGLDEVRKRSARLAAERRRLEAAVAELRALEGDRFGSVRLLAALAEAVPATVWLESVAELGGAGAGEAAFRIRGFAPGGTAEGQAAAGAFVRALGETGAAREVRLGGVSPLRLGSFPLLRFEVTGVLAPGEEIPGTGRSAEARALGYGGTSGPSTPSPER